MSSHSVRLCVQPPALAWEGDAGACLMSGDNAGVQESRDT